MGGTSPVGWLGMAVIVAHVTRAAARTG